MTDLSPSQQLANRASLVEALRSGKYAQTTHSLAKSSVPTSATSYFCVIGLACELSGLGGWRPSILTEFEYVMGDGRRFILAAPAEVEDFYGLSPTEANDLIGENDEGASFASLADMIEALPPPSEADD